MFEGEWRLERVVDDYFGRETMRFAGTARLFRDDAGLTYEEQGSWSAGSYTGLAANRRYLWRVEGGGIAVFFEDGRPFHRFEPTEHGRASARHDCPPDLYAATYDLALPERWTLHWRVRGPRKDYHSRTDFLRDRQGG